MLTQYGKILQRFIESKNIEQAEKLVLSLEKPNTIIYTILMKAYTTNKDMEKATALLRKMESDPKIQPVQVTYNTYLHCAFRSNNYEFAWTFFKNLKSKDIFTYSISNLYLLKKGIS